MGLMHSGIQQYEDHLATLSPEEKARLYAEAQELAETDDGGTARRHQKPEP